MAVTSPFSIEHAKREPFFPSILLSGPSKSGKTYSALLLAQGFGKRTVLIDTERGRGKLYADRFEYDYISLEPPYTPERYREAMKVAVASNPDTIILDSATHEWIGNGGILRQLDEYLTRAKAAPLFWKNATPMHDRMVEAITWKPKCFYIVTCRAKEKIKMEEATDNNGNKHTDVKRMGMKPMQRWDFAYEFTFMYSIRPDSHVAHPTGTIEGAPLPAGPITTNFGRDLAKWARMPSTQKAAPVGRKK